MNTRQWLTAIAGLLWASTLSAHDFGLDYSVERVAASSLSVAQCAATIQQAANAAGYVARVDQDQTTLALHVSGPRGGGRALVAYCIEAGDRTVYVVQALDYDGPGNPLSAQVKNQVVAALEAAAGH